MNLFLMIITGLVAGATSYFGVAAIRRLAERRRFLDIPNERSSHTRPTPRGGGLAIVAVTMAGSWALWPFMRSEVTAWQWMAFTLGALLVAGVSWIDDLRSLSTRVRLVTHLTGAILVCLAFGVWKEIVIPGLGCFSLGLWGWPLTLLWIVGLTNAYNFMDGIDGIAGGQAVVAGVGWLILGIIGGNPFLSVIGVLLTASCLGFLGHNWPPAKIFMGDVGSAFLGYVFAVLPVVVAQSNPRFMLIGALLVWPFIFDTVFTFLRRLINRENVLAAHRSHIYQRLVISGLSHQTVTLLYVALAVLGLVLAIVFLMN